MKTFIGATLMAIGMLVLVSGYSGGCAAEGQTITVERAKSCAAPVLAVLALCQSEPQSLIRQDCVLRSVNALVSCLGGNTTVVGPPPNPVTVGLTETKAMDACPISRANLSALTYSLPRSMATDDVRLVNTTHARRVASPDDWPNKD